MSIVDAGRGRGVANGLIWSQNAIENVGRLPQGGARVDVQVLTDAVDG